MRLTSCAAKAQSSSNCHNRHGLNLLVLTGSGNPTRLGGHYMASPVQFGIFDWIDRSELSIADNYDMRLRMLEIRRQCRILLLPLGGAPRLALGNGSLARSVPVRRRATHQEHPAGAVGLFAAHLQPSTADPGNLYAGPPVPWAVGLGSGQGNLSYRTVLLQRVQRAVASDVPRGLGHHHERPHLRGARLPRGAFLFRRAYSCTWSLTSVPIHRCGTRPIA